MKTSTFTQNEVFLGQLTSTNALVKICAIERSLNERHRPQISWKSGKISLSLWAIRSLSIVHFTLPNHRFFGYLAKICGIIYSLM